MGYVHHHAIVVTSWDSPSIEAAAEKARELGIQVLGPGEGVMNGYRSILVCPDGSKEGWDTSQEGDTKRGMFRSWLVTQAHEDGSSDLEWVEVAYGNDDSGADITNHAWQYKET